MPAVYLPVEMWYLISTYLSAEYLWYPFRALVASTHTLVTEQMDSMWQQWYQQEFQMVHRNLHQLPQGWNNNKPWFRLFVERTLLLNRFWSKPNEPLQLLPKNVALIKSSSSKKKKTTTTTTTTNLMQWVCHSLNKAKSALDKLERDRLLHALKKQTKKSKPEMQQQQVLFKLIYQLQSKHCNTMHYHCDALQSLVKYYASQSKYAHVVVYASMWIKCLQKQYEPFCMAHVHPMSRNLLGYAYFARGHAHFKLQMFEQAKQDLTTSIEHHDYIKSHAFFCRMIVLVKMEQYKAAYKDYHSIGNKSKYAHKIPYFKMAEYLYSKQKYKDCKFLYKQSSKNSMLKWKRLFTCSWKLQHFDKAYELYQQAHEWVQQEQQTTPKSWVETNDDLHVKHIVPRMEALQASQSCSSSSPREQNKSLLQEVQLYYFIKLQFTIWMQQQATTEKVVDSGKINKYWQKIGQVNQHKPVLV